LIEILKPSRKKQIWNLLIFMWNTYPNSHTTTIIF